MYKFYQSKKCCVFQTILNAEITEKQQDELLQACDYLGRIDKKCAEENKEAIKKIDDQVKMAIELIQHNDKCDTKKITISTLQKLESLLENGLKEALKILTLLKNIEKDAISIYLLHKEDSLTITGNEIWQKFQKIEKIQNCIKEGKIKEVISDYRYEEVFGFFHELAGTPEINLTQIMKEQNTGIYALLNKNHFC